MASKYKFTTRDERIEKMAQDNPGRPIELCTAVVDGMWDKKRELINSHIPDRYKNASMQDLGYLEKEIFQAMTEVFDIPESNDITGIIFCGSAGSGKTHAAYALLKYIAEVNPEMIAYMTTYSQAFSSIKSEFANNSYDEMGSTWDRMNNESGIYPGILFIDDVSAQKLTDFEIDKMMMFFENRFNSYMPFLITTNVKLEDFKTVFGPRLASRLLGYCAIVEFEERDKRVETNENNEENLC